MRKMIQMCVVTAALSAVPATASTFTLTSPTGGPLPSGVSAVGGVVTDLTGINGVRVVAQASAGSEFVGYVPGYTGSGNQGTKYLLFAQQAGISPTVLAALGGGLSAASFRVTLYDGDTQAGDFDFNENALYIGTGSGSVGAATTTSSGMNFGNLSTIATQRTDGLGAAIGSNTLGFGNDILDTGFFASTNLIALSGLYDSLAAAAAGNQTLNFQLRDNTYGDQYYDFTEGIDSSLINVGSGPMVVSATPEPSSMLLMGTGLLCLAGKLKRHVSQ